MHGANGCDGIIEEAQAHKYVGRQLHGHAKERHGWEPHEATDHVVRHLLCLIAGLGVGLVAILSWPCVAFAVLRSAVIVVIPFLHRCWATCPGVLRRCGARKAPWKIMTGCTELVPFLRAGQLWDLEPLKQPEGLNTRVFGKPQSRAYIPRCPLDGVGLEIPLKLRARRAVWVGNVDLPAEHVEGLNILRNV